MKIITILPHDVTFGEATVDGERQFAMTLRDDEADVTVQALFSFDDLEDNMPGLWEAYKALAAGPAKQVRTASN